MRSKRIGFCPPFCKRRVQEVMFLTPYNIQYISGKMCACCLDFIQKDVFFLKIKKNCTAFNAETKTSILGKITLLLSLQCFMYMYTQVKKKKMQVQFSLGTLPYILYIRQVAVNLQKMHRFQRANNSTVFLYLANRIGIAPPRALGIIYISLVHDGTERPCEQIVAQEAKRPKYIFQDISCTYVMYTS